LFRDETCVFYRRRRHGILQLIGNGIRRDYKLRVYQRVLVEILADMAERVR